jgi:hypothetical protein
VQKAENYRIMVPSQPGTSKKMVRLHLNGKLGVVMHACEPSNGGKPKIGGFWSRLA